MISSLTIMDGTTQHNIELCQLSRDWYYLDLYQLCRVSHKSHFPTTAWITSIAFKTLTCITWIFCCFKDILLQPTSSSCMLQPFSRICFFALNACCPLFTIIKRATSTAYNLKHSLQSPDACVWWFSMKYFSKWGNVSERFLS